MIRKVSFHFLHSDFTELTTFYSCSAANFERTVLIWHATVKYFGSVPQVSSMEQKVKGDLPHDRVGTLSGLVSISSHTCTVSSSLVGLESENGMSLSSFIFEKNNKTLYFDRHKKVTKIWGPTFLLSLVERRLIAKKLPTALLYYHSKDQASTTNSSGVTRPFGWKTNFGPNFRNLWRKFSNPSETNFKNPARSFDHNFDKLSNEVSTSALRQLYE